MRVANTGRVGRVTIESGTEQQSGASMRQEWPVTRQMGDHLGESADDLIGDLRALRRPRVFIVSGPSGVGKDAIIERLRERYPEAFFAVTATTRERRPGEIDGVHYYFLSEANFRARLAEGEFLESANVYGNLYGV